MKLITKYVSKPVQCSFPHVQVASNQFDPSKPKYSVIILIPKTDTEEVEKINKCYEAAIEEGIEIPEPVSPDKYSGQFKLRIPKSLHYSLAEHAKMEGISMNQYCLYLLAKNDAVRHA